MSHNLLTFDEAAAAIAHFQFQAYRLLLTATTPIRLPPYKGSAFRGGFGHALKQSVCHTPAAVCDTCRMPEQCPYPYLFETTIALHTAEKVQHEAVPRPFVLIPPRETYRQYEPGDVLTCDLVLIGEATHYVPVFIKAFEQLGRLGLGEGQGRYELTQIHGMRPYAPAYVVSMGFGDTMRNGKPPITGAELIAPSLQAAPCSLTLAFETPTRLKYQGKYLTVAPPFHVIMRRLLDRLAELSLYYHGVPLALDMRAWKKHAEPIRTVASRVSPYDWERYSSRQQTRMRLGGIVGTVTYTGDLAPFVPLLVLGQWLHVGKGATFGLGEYRIAEMNGER